MSCELKIHTGVKEAGEEKGLTFEREETFTRKSCFEVTRGNFKVEIPPFNTKLAWVGWYGKSLDCKDSTSSDMA